MSKQLKLLPYAIVGIIIFALNSQGDMHPHLQIYITLLEAKVGIVLVYLVNKKLGGKFSKINGISRGN